MSVPHIPALDTEAEPGISGGLRKPSLSVVAGVGTGASEWGQTALRPSSLPLCPWELQHTLRSPRSEGSSTLVLRVKDDTQQGPLLGAWKAGDRWGAEPGACWGRMRHHPGLLFAVP